MHEERQRIRLGSRGSPVGNAEYAKDVEKPPSRRARIAFALWVGVILIVVVPWYRWQGHSHWDHVQWVPFSRPPYHLRDMVLNTLFYVPFGLLYRRMMPRPMPGPVLAAFLLSSATELSQVYSHGRFPSATDVFCNVLGAWIGMRWYDGRSDRSDRSDRSTDGGRDPRTA